MEPPVVDEETLRWTVEVRRHLHRHPEPTGEEVRTQANILEFLKEIGIEGRPIAGNGVIADIAGAASGPTVALRADMDALLIEEAETGLNAEYISQNPGVMHACGHDGHMAMVLGVARVLVGMGDRLPGRVRLLFQPHEELDPGGSQAVIDEGGLDGVDAILGLHIMGYLPLGTLALRPGPIMAHIRLFDVFITGKSGHHMDPEHVIDPIVMAGRFVTTVERDARAAVDPTHPFCLGFGQVHGGTLYNQTPDEVHVSGTFRTFSDEDADAIGQAMDHNLRGLVAAFARDPEEELPSVRLRITPGYPVLENDPGLAARAASVLPGTLPGVDVDPDTRLNFGAEDFARYAQRVPALLMFLGTRNESRGITAVNHSSRFDIDEDVLATGVRALVTMTMDIMKR